MVNNWSETENKDYDKGDLKDELKSAGFEDCVADNIADRVDDKSTDRWTQRQARQEAAREIQIFMDSTRQAYDNFKKNIGSYRETVSTATM